MGQWHQKMSYSSYTLSKIMQVYQASQHPSIGNPASEMEMESKVECEYISKKNCYNSFEVFEDCI